MKEPSVLHLHHLFLQTPKVAKVQVTWPSTDLLQVPLNPSTRVTHILKLFTERLNPGSQPEDGREDSGSVLSE